MGGWQVSGGALRTVVCGVMAGLLLAAGGVTVVAESRAPATGSTPASELAMGTVVLLAGTPHLWIVDREGALRWVGETRALAGMVVDWSRLETRSLAQLRQLPRRDPLLSTGLVALGNEIYVARWDTWQPVPALLHVQSPDDLSLLGIDQANYGALVLERAQWERRFGISVEGLERSDLTPFSPLMTLMMPPYDAAKEASAWQAALATAPALGPGGTGATAFPGRLRLPPLSLPLLDGLQLRGSGVEPARGEAPAEFVVIFRGPAPAGPAVALPLSDSSVIVQGSVGRSMYDWVRDQPHGCEGAAGYCATYLRLEGDPVGGLQPDGTVTPPVHEHFGEWFTAAGHPATVTHAAMGNGEWWEVDWYDAEADVSYSANFYLEIATRVGAPGLAPTNAGYAQLLADLTSKFVAVPAL